MGPPGIHFNEYVDGSCQSEDVGKVDVLVYLHGPGMNQIRELESETSGVARESGDGDEIARKRAHFCLLALCPAERGGCPRVHRQ